MCNLIFCNGSFLIFSYYNIHYVLITCFLIILFGQSSNGRCSQIKFSSTAISTEHRLSEPTTSPPKRECSMVIQIIQLISTILVPLMIGSFAIVTTLQESNSAQLQRQAEIIKMERQAQLQEDAEKRQGDKEIIQRHEQ
ncbi:hypothetical protein I4U23_011796 [Adineta vaga]|nr:hypothetical protein I4U23_011796 [Adineta vaga]